ncbi:sensor histidine kinase [Salisediminibacterium halotolerans]|uniref:sensor histidine kinase n=1 Tax=Salisediminibacterium halotolerans TaxID=517425 RepID=UPI000EB2995A|nr:sensor histidine kinase [Salisediminibacterium halotolerans]RLJ69699.1 two-component system sensor histidine kinase DesK [Actinophytocola xinjiangensis]RPE89757.1 two-component system sensor histidine kinase DesK [Salisediminibacterium halotolerans]TWG32593.1 two-component system sensor histidine kinase DesK [Salisediminibacterium halotolerans]GEL08968.1 sensor histidine kinase DesK [Salisediminibacterium halotolerans]
MKRRHRTFMKNHGLSPYVWIFLSILPFYFIFQDSTTLEIAVGTAMVAGFFLSYGLSFSTRGGAVYAGAGVQMVIAAAMTLLFGYMYFFLFLAYFIGHLTKRAAFWTFYPILLTSTFATSYYGFITHTEFITQLPFVFLSLIAVILLPVSTYNKVKEDRLQGQLEDANQKISELVKMEERQRIARDLHDTLGQQLSMIGLKSDLAEKLLEKDPGKAAKEIKEVQKTARISLKELRELVTQMRGTKLEDEMDRVKQLLAAANISCTVEGSLTLPHSLAIAESVVSMCLKEAVTNVVKHSGAANCHIKVESTKNALTVTVTDDGRGIPSSGKLNHSESGISGMKERLEFVNGTLDVSSNNGTTVVIHVPGDART